MKSGIERILAATAAYGLAGAVAITGLIKIGQAQEAAACPAAACPNASTPSDQPPSGYVPDVRQFANRAVRALQAEFGEGFLFHVNVQRFGSPVAGTITGPTSCEQLLDRIVSQANEQDVEGISVSRFDLHVVGDLPETRRIILSRVGVRPGEIIDTRGVRNSEHRLKAAQLAGTTDCEQAQLAAGFLRLGCPCGTTGPCECTAKASHAAECANGVCAASACTAASATAVCSSTTATGCKCEDCKCGSCKCESCQCKAKASLTAEIKCGEELACGRDGKCNEETVCGGENCSIAALVALQTQADEAALSDPLKLTRHIAGLMAEKAAAEALLEAKSESHEEVLELYEMLAELMADNAALDAQVKAHDEQSKLTTKLADLAVENAKLKAQVEMAAERAELARTSFSLQLENERLMVRVAELEKHQALEDAARTAAKQQAERQLR